MALKEAILNFVKYGKVTTLGHLYEPYSDEVFATTEKLEFTRSEQGLTDPMIIGQCPLDYHFWGPPPTCPASLEKARIVTNMVRPVELSIHPWQ